MEEQFVWFIIAFVTALIFGTLLYGWFYTDIQGATKKETLANMKEIFWTNTAMGWMWREFFGKKKKAKQAPTFSTGSSNHMYINPPPPPAGTATQRGFLTIPPPPISTYNTSSLHRSPHKIGKPFVIKNWDRLMGMTFQSYGWSWSVVQSAKTSYGYECVVEAALTSKTVVITVSDDMYDSHRVMVKCSNRSTYFNVDDFKHPHQMLEKITIEFQEYFT